MLRTRGRKCNRARPLLPRRPRSGSGGFGERARMHGTANPTPRYHQVYLLLRQKIMEGRWPPGTPMPGEHELAGMHRVSRITIRNALSRLAQEGLISRRRGAGTFVRPPKPSRRSDNLHGHFRNLFAMGERTGVRLVSFS